MSGDSSFLSTFLCDSLKSCIIRALVSGEPLSFATAGSTFWYMASSEDELEEAEEPEHDEPVELPALESPEEPS